MPSMVKRLCERQVIRQVPSHVPEGIQYEVIMGSFAYGVSSDTSDMDVYGFSIPNKELVFPHLRGEIEGFGPKGNRFEVWTQHHINDPSAAGGHGKDYDFSIYSIVKYFDLVMANNPNMIDSLFVPDRCITHITPIGQMVRDHRKMFLHKRSWHTFKGYAFQQLHKLRNKTPESGKRLELIEKFGYDVKFAYHIVRLMREVEQILVEGDLDLERHREELKSIRRGEWAIEDIENFFNDRQSGLNKAYEDSKLPHGPDVDKIRKLLVDCLEQHFGDISSAVQMIDPALRALNDIESVLDNFRKSHGS